MSKKQRDRLVLSAALLIIVGFILTISHACAGWFLILLGMTYLCGLTSTGQHWVAQNPDYLRWGLIAGAVVFVIMVIGVVL